MGLPKRIALKFLKSSRLLIPGSRLTPCIFCDRDLRAMALPWVLRKDMQFTEQTQQLYTHEPKDFTLFYSDILINYPKSPRTDTYTHTPFLDCYCSLLMFIVHWCRSLWFLHVFAESRVMGLNCAACLVWPRRKLVLATRGDTYFGSNLLT